MLLAPILFGVPHVAADLRYLVFEPVRPLPSRLGTGIAAMLLAMTAVRVSAMLGGPALPRVELVLGLVAVGGSLAWTRSHALLGALGVLGVACLAWPPEAALLVGHAHNFVAVALWFAWTRGGGRWWVVVAIALVNGVLFGGGFDAWIVARASGGAAGLTLGSLVAGLAPDLPGPWGVRAVASFAFMQAVHYALWLVAIPVSRHGSPIDGWLRALGPSLIAVTVLGTLALLAWGWADPTGARSGYLGLVLFHGWLELAVAAFLVGARE
ncbi:MAG: hypothetical protein EP330_00630 [Deltaproteobacteria bacterium]|nr:MAG: hypothetical protein EP330_00630 [Deltaproteobacteria bacterium]